jgi:hypothetical protein
MIFENFFCIYCDGHACCRYGYTTLQTRLIATDLGVVPVQEVHHLRHIEETRRKAALQRSVMVAKVIDFTMEFVDLKARSLFLALVRLSCTLEVTLVLRDLRTGTLQNVIKELRIILRKHGTSILGFTELILDVQQLQAGSHLG